MIDTDHMLSNFVKSLKKYAIPKVFTSDLVSDMTLTPTFKTSLVHLQFQLTLSTRSSYGEIFPLSIGF